MDEQFTASEVRNAIPCKETRNSAMLRAYADLLEAREKAVPVAWSLIFEESIGVNAPTTYNRREDAEDYADACAMPDKCNPFPHRPKVVPLYTHPTPADADRLAEQRDDAFQQAVQEARRVWMDEFPCEAGHDHVTPFDQFLYGNRPCMEAQPPAARVTDAIARRMVAEYDAVLCGDPTATRTDGMRAALKAALAAAPQQQAAEPVASVGRYPGGGPRLDLLVPPDRAPPEGALLYARAATPHVERMTEALRNLCAEMASVAKERGVSRDQVNTYRWCKRRIMAIVADHLTKTHPQPVQDAKFAPPETEDDVMAYLQIARLHIKRFREVLQEALTQERDND